MGNDDRNSDPGVFQSAQVLIVIARWVKQHDGYVVSRLSQVNGVIQQNFVGSTYRAEKTGLAKGDLQSFILVSRFV
jgi:hypothetical protein